MSEDLFGHEVSYEHREKNRTKLHKVLPHYRPAAISSRSCATCAHCRVIEIHRVKVKRWRKCELVGGGSPATDVKARWVCDAWEQGEG